VRVVVSAAAAAFRIPHVSASRLWAEDLVLVLKVAMVLGELAAAADMRTAWLGLRPGSSPPRD
jgi:hypothetical protein